MNAGPTKEVILWTDDVGCPQVRKLLDVTGSTVHPIGVGSPRGGDVEDLARSLDCTRGDDLRKLIVENPASCLLLTTMRGVATDDLHTATDQGTLIVSLEPIAHDFDTLAALSPIAGNVHHLPAFLQSPGYVLSADPNEALGDGRMMSYHNVGLARHASLYARLWDAWHTVLNYAEPPQSIDASLTGPGDAIPQHLSQLTGRLTAHGRAAEQGSAVLELTDLAGRDYRSLHGVGELAELRIDDAGYQLHQIGGELVDEGKTKESTCWVDLIAYHWRRLLDRPNTASTNESRLRDTLACCQATLLSARTGQPESPQNLLQMHGG